MDCIQEEDGLNGLYVGGGWIKCIASRKRMDLMDLIQKEDGLNALYLEGGWIKWIVCRRRMDY